MFKIVYRHLNSADLILARKEYMLHLKNGDITTPVNWQPTIIIFGFIRINL